MGASAARIHCDAIQILEPNGGRHMKTRFFFTIGIALLAAATSTQADRQQQGVMTNGSNLQGVMTNGSNLQGVMTNGSNLQGVMTNGAEAARPEIGSTGLSLDAFHVIGGRLFLGAPSRSPRRDRP
jgi:hypothetical protein